jgi:hypothetical protein
MDCLRRLFDDPTVLVHDSSLGGALAQYGALAISVPTAGLGVDVDRPRRRDLALAERCALFDWMELDSCRTVACDWFVDIQTSRRAFQLEATQWLARGAAGPSRAAAGDKWNSRSGAASVVPGPSVRDAGVECGNGPGGGLAANGLCSDHRRNDDSNGRCGTREEVWASVLGISRARAGSAAPLRRRVRAKHLQSSRPANPCQDRPENLSLSAGLRRRAIAGLEIGF